MSSKLFVCFAIFALAAVAFAAEPAPANDRVKKDAYAPAYAAGAYPYAGYGYNYGYAASPYNYGYAGASPYSYGYSGASPYSYGAYNSYPYAGYARSAYSGHYPSNYYNNHNGYYQYAY